MKFLILDPYTNDNWRLVKDTAGGYGTGNDFGNSLFSKAINVFVSKMISILRCTQFIFFQYQDRGCEVDYSRNVNKVNLNDYDYIIMTSSIFVLKQKLKF